LRADAAKLRGETDGRETNEMKKTIGAASLLMALAALSACGAKKDPNALTSEENRQLDNAAEMLDASPDSLTANDDVAPGNGDEDNAEDGDGDEAGNGAGNGQ
jgi:predicted small lipoprotein YifL